MIEACICGKDWTNELIDSLYPMNRERSRWVFRCALHNFGCGREVIGGSEEEVIELWNRGIFELWNV